MPSVSKKQHNFMAAIAHSPAFAKKVGVPQSVGEDFNKADKGRKFGKGGETRPDLQKIAKPKTDHGKMALFKEGGTVKHDDIKEDKALIKKAFGMHDKQLHESKKTDLTKLNKGGVMKAKETMGPRTMSMDVEKGSNKLLKHGESGVQKRGHTKGKNLGDAGKIMPIQKMAKGGMCGGGKTMKKMSTGGMASKRADGIASKGKTKGKIC